MQKYEEMSTSLQLNVLFCYVAFFPVQLFEPTECGNGYVEVGEECDCGVRAVSHCFAIVGMGDIVFTDKSECYIVIQI